MSKSAGKIRLLVSKYFRPKCKKEILPTYLSLKRSSRIPISTTKMYSLDTVPSNIYSKYIQDHTNGYNN